MDESISVDITIVSEKEFNLLQDILDIENNRLAIGMVIRGEPYIVANEDLFNLDENIQYLILSKEAAFALGDATTEEEANQWIFNGLNSASKEILEGLRLKTSC